MSGIIERSLELGLGALTLTKEKIEEMVEDLDKLRDAPRERGRELVDRLLEKGREARQELREFIARETEQALAKANLAPRSELEALKARVEALEARRSPTPETEPEAQATEAPPASESGTGTDDAGA